MPYKLIIIIIIVSAFAWFAYPAKDKAIVKFKKLEVRHNKWNEWELVDMANETNIEAKLSWKEVE